MIQGTSRLSPLAHKGINIGTAWAVRYPLGMASMRWHGIGSGMGMGWAGLRLIASFPAPFDGTWRAYVRSHHTPPPPKKIRVLCYRANSLTEGLMDNVIEVESGIAIPEPRTKAKGGVYPYTQMQVGDSFLVNEDRNNLLIYVCNKNRKAAKAYNTKYTAKRVEGGVRVWRVL